VTLLEQANILVGLHRKLNEHYHQFFPTLLRFISHFILSIVERNFVYFITFAGFYRSIAPGFNHVAFLLCPHRRAALSDTAIRPSVCLSLGYSICWLHGAAA